MKKSIITLFFAAVAATLWAVDYGNSPHHPFLTQVYDYKPAPGQFVNVLPTYNAGEPFDSVLSRCREALCGHIDTTTVEFNDEILTRIDTTLLPSMITLGAYGGYVIVGFDHPVVNNHTYDFEIFGNAFVSNQDSHGGSCEPGIVMVSRDVNGNGLPDDPWYELAGSEYNNPRTQHNYALTYYKPTDSNVSPNETNYIRWTSNDALNPDSTSGYVAKNQFHNQSYWPQWITADTLTFTGAKLPCNAINKGTTTQYWVQYFFDYGYVDNLPNNPKLAGNASAGDDYNTGLYNPGFKLDWAVDADGTPVSLKKIDFIKIYNAENQQCGWLGETSTEVAGGIDIHPKAAEPQELMGDANDDGKVDVADVTTTVSHMLSQRVAKFNPVQADVTANGKIDVADVTATVAIMLAK